MQDVKETEINEIKKPESENFKNIKPEKGTTGKDCNSFWDNEFKKEAEYYNDYEERLGYTPKEDSQLGRCPKGRSSRCPCPPSCR